MDERQKATREAGISDRFEAVGVKLISKDKPTI